MAIVPFTSTLNLTTWRSNMDDKRASLNTSALLGTKGFELFDGPITSLTSATLLRDRSFTFTPTDDWDYATVFAHGTADAISRTISVTMTVADTDDLTFLVDKDLTKTATSTGAVNTDARLTTELFLRAPRDVPLVVAVECTTAGSFANVVYGVALRSRRRRA